MKANLKKIEGGWFASINEDTNIDIHPENTGLLDGMEELGWVNLIREINFEVVNENGKDLAKLRKSDENPENHATKCYCGHTDWCDCLPHCSYEACEEVKNSLRASLIYDPNGGTFLQWLMENYTLTEKKEN